MQAYDFDPQRMRAAHQQILEWFGQGSAGPGGLDAIFAALAQMNLADVADWGRGISAKELDLLGRHYAKAPSARVLAALVILFESKTDERCFQILQLWVHQGPPEDQYRYLAALSLGGKGFMAQAPTWILDLFQAQDPALVGTIVELLKKHSLNSDQLTQDVPVRTPLLKKLMLRAFQQEPDILPLLNPEFVTRYAASCLEAGEDSTVLAYLNHMGVEHWEPRFLEMMVKRKGLPNRDSDPFYGQLESGRIWGIRRKLFAARVQSAKLDGPRKEFWLKWLHRCSQWRRTKTGAVVEIGGLRIEESKNGSGIGPAGQKPNRFIDYDYQWVSQMEDLLSATAQWGRE